MFLTSLDLSDLAVVLPQNDVVSWSSAAKALFYIGYRAELPIANLKVVYGDEVSEEILNDHNIFAFGRSSTLPFLSEINDLLPAPFENGSDEATQPSMFVNYSLLPDTSVGYLEVLSSPFNSERVIMAVLGNTELGIPMAGATLTQDELVSKLTGNFSIIYYDQIVSTDTRLGVSKQGIVSELPVAVTVTPSAAISDPLLPDSQVFVEERPRWILPAIIITSVLMVMVLAIITFKGILGRKPKDGSSTENKVNTPE
jgi:cellulose synthase operon protein B